MEVPTDWSGKYFNPAFRYQYVATFTGTLLMVSTGMHYGWPSPSLPILLKGNSEIPITNSEGSWIAAVPFMGVPFGCIISLVLVDTIGRRNCMLMASPVLFLMWFAVAYARSALILIFARFLAGVGDGLAHTALPMYIAEIADKNIRGLLGSSVQVAFMFGVLAINIIGISFSIKTTAFIASVIPLVHFVTVFFIKESPYFLILRHKDTKAASSLRKFNRIQNVDSELAELKTVITLDSKNSRNLLGMFKSKSNQKGLGIIMGILAIEQLAGYHAISFYCLTIFEESGGAITPTTATIIYFSVQLIATTLSSVLVDITGRRLLLIIAVVGSGFGLAGESLYFYLKNETSVDMSRLSLLPLIALFIYTVSYSTGLSTIPILMASELFTMSAKALFMCVTTICFSILLIVVSKLFQIVKDEYGMHVPFAIFTLCCVMGLIFIIYCVPETGRLTLEEIQVELFST